MTSIFKFTHMESNSSHRSKVAGVLWDLTLSWYFNTFSHSMGPSLKEFTATLIHQTGVPGQGLNMFQSDTGQLVHKAFKRASASASELSKAWCLLGCMSAKTKDSLLS